MFSTLYISMTALQGAHLIGTTAANQRSHKLIKVWHLGIELQEINTKNQKNARGCLAQHCHFQWPTLCPYNCTLRLLASALQFHRLSVPENPVWLLHIKDSPWKKKTTLFFDDVVKAQRKKSKASHFWMRKKLPDISAKVNLMHFWIALSTFTLKCMLPL